MGGWRRPQRERESTAGPVVPDASCQGDLKIIPRWFKIRAISLTALWMLAVISVFIVGCAGAESTVASSPTLTPSPTPVPSLNTAVASTQATTSTFGSSADESALRERLEAMLFPLEALPAGFRIQTADFTTNQEAALADPDGLERALEDFQRWGRLLGYRVRYASEDALEVFRTGGLLAVVARVVQHRDPAGADEAFRHWEQRLQDQSYLEGRLVTRPGATFERFEPLGEVALGEHSLAVDAVLSVQTGEGATPFVTRFYLFQREASMGLVELFYVGEITGEITKEITLFKGGEALAQSMDSRIQAQQAP